MIIFPQKLKKGAKIGIVSPAGAVEASQIQAGIERIQSKGYEPILSPYCLGIFKNGYNYSGTEKERLSDINWAFSNSELSAVWATRGGYGCQHLIKKIKLSAFRENPKWYIGYSDNTVIQSYLLKNGFASIHGQTLKTASFGVSEESYEFIFDVLEGTLPKYKITPHSFNKEGVAEGILIGGNLALVYALLGSPYSFNFKDKILFIEDIGENFYALDRMLMGLELAGVFRKIKGLIIGGMTNMDSETDNPNYENSFDSVVYEIVKQRLEKYKIPMMYQFPNGHIYHNLPLILGASVRLEITSEKAELFYL